jgi:small GTP-binding protein
MKKLVVGILAHVDAGKTTLSEALLYLSGRIRKPGRVDNKDAFLDHFELERARGITIFSKQAVFTVEDTQITLLDTPGHVDFSTEMERTLRVLDYGILVISGSDGVQAHTKTLWRLLSIYRIPVFIFVNKMDQTEIIKEKLLEELKAQLGDGCINFEQDNTAGFYDQLAMCDEHMMEAFLDTGHLTVPQIRKSIRERRVFPCFFGSALKLEGIEAFLKGMVLYADNPDYPQQFGARIFKVSRDEQGNRLTHMKITGGKLKVKDSVSNGVWEEKVHQIRLYSGRKFEVVNEAEAGSICTVTGLNTAKPGEGLGAEEGSAPPVLESVFTYQIRLPDGCDPRAMLPKLRQIEEEEPELHIVWDEELQEIHAQIMGEVQIEILQSLIKSRFGVDVSIGSGRIVYKETIAKPVEGVGHFEPLRHYAEVHLLMEPGERGSGLQFAVDCSDDVLAANWKNLILSHLKEKVHRGVLTGSPITDMKITLVSGKAHNKHTEGGDFREATWRAVRQGLKEAESVLLEPWYVFQLEVPEKMVGRAMSDIEQLHGRCHLSHVEGDMAVLQGEGPVATLRNYQMDVMAYTKGQGKLFCSLKGYEPCHNAEEVIETIGYDSERDVNNPTGSVFCANGAGFLVSWNEVKKYMHIPSCFEEKTDAEEKVYGRVSQTPQEWLPPEEVDRILNQASFANMGRKSSWLKRRSTAESFHKPVTYLGLPKENKDEYLLVDGYNIIFAWPELKTLAEDNMDSARNRLLEALMKYQGVRKCRVIAVFDAYRVQGHIEEVIDYGNIHVVYTREAQTADQYIEKFAHDNMKKYAITVATSDGLQQIIIRGSGSTVMSASELKTEIERVNDSVLKAYQERQPPDINPVKDALSADTRQQMENFLKEDEFTDAKERNN